MAEKMKYEGATVIDTQSEAKDGQTKCPKCGATDISLNPKTGMLRCNFCRTEFAAEKSDGWVEDISSLKGEVIGSGAQDIDKSKEDANRIVTFKCSSCGAEVVVDTSEATQARCHWCRNVLSVNEQIPNGAVPDMVLPFKLGRKEAKAKIESFVGSRKFYAHPNFTKDFTADNVMGVYLPYMVVDANTHAEFAGQGEHQVRSYTEHHKDRDGKEVSETFYDADLYEIERKFDMTVTGLTAASSADKAKRHTSDRTNNIIDAIQPFDTENCVKWDANFLHGYSSEKRDVNINDLKETVNIQVKDIARNEAGHTLNFYDRGVRWDKENVTVKGSQWKTAYLPIWLFSYQEKKGDKDSLLHYVAVNARTEETIGSIPLYKSKLLGVTIAIEVIIAILAYLIQSATGSNLAWIFLIAGFIYYSIIYGRYRNTSARHRHEMETTRNVTGLQKKDTLLKHLMHIKNPSMHNTNSNRVDLM